MSQGQTDTAALPPNPWAPKGPPKVGRPFPRLPLFGALALILFAIGATIFGQATGIGVVKTGQSQPLIIRDIIFDERANEEIAVIDGHSRQAIEVIAPEADGFIRGMLRGMSRDRRVRGAAVDAPYRLIRWNDGRVTLSDTTSGLRIDLKAFGQSNLQAVARFLKEGE